MFYITYPHFKIANPERKRSRPITIKAPTRPTDRASSGPLNEPINTEAFRMTLYQARWAGRSSMGISSSR